MARLRHLLISIGLCGLFAACDRPAAPVAAVAPAPAPEAPGTPPSAPEVPADTAWKSQVPSIGATEIPDTLRQADEALARGQLDQDRSPGPGALELYLAILAIEPGNEWAVAGVESSLDALLERGRLATPARARSFPGSMARIAR